MGLLELQDDAGIIEINGSRSSQPRRISAFRTKTQPMPTPQPGDNDALKDDSDLTWSAADESRTIVQMRNVLARLGSGDPSARDEVIAIANERLTQLSRRIFRGEFASLGNAEVTTDVWHEAFFKLRNALDDVTPTTPREFFGLAARNIRWTLLDMVRKAQGRRAKRGAESGGPSGSAGKKAGRPKMILDGAPGDGMLGQVAAESGDDPVDLAVWGEFHEAVNNLPERLREIFDLHFYHGLTQQEVADAMGVNVRTIKRHWLQARLELVKAMEGRMPDP
jgi:RNA polymerase sigma factor (sigma-70 family)